MSAWDRLEDAIRAAQRGDHEIIVTLRGGSEYGWTCELKYVPNPNRARHADVSLAFYSAGDVTPETALDECLDELQDVATDRALRAVDRLHRGLPRWDELGPRAPGDTEVEAE